MVDKETNYDECCQDWKDQILSIDDPKVLNFIRDLVSARIQIGHAEDSMSGDGDRYSNPNMKNKKFNPLNIPTEPDDLNEIG